MGTKTYPEAIKHYPIPTQIFIKTIHNRIESGKNALIIVVGGTGSGKSLSTLSLQIGLYLYRFGVMPSVEYATEHCIFKAKHLMEKLNEKDLQKKECWNWDEAGIDIGHKSHATIQNRVIGYLAQTFRNLQQILFFTVPTANFIDASVRKLLHYYLETRYIDKSNRICIIRPLHMQYNTKMDKIYYHSLTYPAGDGEYYEVDVMGVPLPPPEYVEAYETKKSAFTSDLNLRIQSQLQAIDLKEQKEQRAATEGVKLTERQQKILDLMEQGIVKTGKLAEIMGISSVTVSKNLKFMKNKGINIQKYKENVDFTLFNSKKSKNQFKFDMLPKTFKQC
jgi:hypothetical protein